MGLYAEKLMDAVRNMTGNSPIKTTSTTTMKGNEGLDIGSLMMMLMMSGMFNKGKGAAPGASDIMNPMDTLGPMNSGGGFGGPMTQVQGSPTGLVSPSGGLDGLMRMLASLGPLLGK